MRKTKRSFAPRPLALLLAGLGLVVLVAALSLHAIHQAPTRQPHTSPTTAGQSTKGEATNTPSPGSTSQPSGNSTPGTTKGETTPTGTLVQPTGDFVSAHNNVPLNAPLSSVCNTSAGAQCQIVFTSGDQTHSLPMQTTDLGGATYWSSWTPASIGLTSGSWQIKAVATLGTQVQSATDALNLTVVAQ